VLTTGGRGGGTGARGTVALSPDELAASASFAGVAASPSRVADVDGPLCAVSNTAPWRVTPRCGSLTVTRARV
jgi:hypothetical protein